jgi:hypothetical protein
MLIPDQVILADSYEAQILGYVSDTDMGIPEYEIFEKCRYRNTLYI